MSNFSKMLIDNGWRLTAMGEYTIMWLYVLYLFIRMNKYLGGKLMKGQELQQPRLTLRMTKELHHWFKGYALEHHTTMSVMSFLRN